MKQGERIGALDGIRCFAVLLAIVFHANAVWPSVRQSILPFVGSGFIGVDIFFVLSGFLISGLLLGEFQRTGKIRYSKFFVRRILRLLPPMAICLALTLAWAITQGNDPQKFLIGTFAAIFNYFNWLVVLNKKHPVELDHLWSLSVEEQLYVLVAVIFFIVSKTKLRVKVPVALFWASFLLIAWTVFLRFATVDAGSLYYRTDFRFNEFFFGVVAQLYKSKHKDVQTVLLKVMQYPAILFLVYYATQANLDSNFYYIYGSLILSLSCACVILSSTYEGSPLCRFFSMRVFRSIGRVSYSMYLGHWPIFLILSQLSLNGPYKLSVAMAFVFLYSIIIYFVVEKPLESFRHKYLSNFVS